MIFLNMKKTIRLLILCLMPLPFFVSCSGQIIESKINGVSFVASNESIEREKHVDPLANVNANYAAIMPFGFIRNLEHPEVIFNTQRQWFGETSEGAKQYIEELRKNGIRIMLKPQIWVWRGEYTGHIKMTTEADWKTLQDSYSRFILEYARLARDVNAELFCIGTELEQFIVNRQDYWMQLIKDVRAIYKGKLTYAANWDEYKRVPFWGELDFIGVDAYFPLSDEKTPSVEACRKGWQTYKSAIKELSQTYARPVLFTEYGYRSVDFTAKEPWKSDRDMTDVNLQGQENATQALFEEFWNENWFAGGFVWKWYHNNDKAGGINNSRFTPQNKPVEALIKKHYAHQ